MRARRVVSGTIFVGVCLFGVACNESGANDDSSAGSGAQGAMPASGGGAGTGSGGGTGGGGGTGNSDLPNLDPGKLIADLTNEEKAELCDWMVELFGGYNMTTPCAAGSVATFPSREICVMAGLSFTCDIVTVGDVEACTLSEVPSGGCDRSDPSCEALHCQ